jgi:hypothetical protein
MSNFLKICTKAFLVYVCWTSINAFGQTTVVVNPGASIQTAVNAATPGTTIRVTAGTYTQKVLFSSKNGTSGNYITLLADPGVILSGTGLTPSGREGLITITNSSYIRIEGFDIQNFITSGGNTPCGILVQGSGTKVQIVNNKIHNIRNNSTCTDPCGEGAHGLAVFGTSSTSITDILVQGNEVYANILQASESLVINGNVDRFEILGNNVHDNNNIGYDFIGYEDECSGCGENDRVRNGIVRGNISTNNSSTTNPWYSNSGSAGGFYVDGGRFIVFERNISTGNDIGFEFASEHPNKGTEDILMINNYIYNNKDVGVALGGYESGLGEARRIYIHNNSFYKNKGWGSEVTLQYKVINCQFSNNIFFGEGTAAESYESIGTGNTGNVWGTNLWWGTSTASSGLPGTKIVQNPLFTAPASGNLKIQSGSPAINAGALSADITTWTSSIWDVYFPPNGTIPANGLLDINGEARIETTIDLGADEFGSSGGTTITIPAAPSVLTTTTNSASQITLNWSDNATNETGFSIERSVTSGSGYAQIATVGSNVTTYQNTGLTAATTYYYRVAASNSAGTSAYSNVANTATQSSGGSGITITIDGNVSDWASIAAISTTGAGGLTSLKAYSDATNLYILAQGTTNTNYIIFINKDNVATTGFTAGLWSPEGSDYSLENGTLYKYNGTGTTWGWTTTGVTQTSISAIKNSTAIEVKIPKANLAGLATTIKLGLDVENSGWTTVATIPAEGGPQASYSVSTGARLAAEVSTKAVTEESSASSSLFPNPSTGAVQFSYYVDQPDQAMTINIYSQNGSQAKELKFIEPVAGKQEKTIHLHDLHDGLYVMRIKVGSSIDTHKILLKR